MCKAFARNINASCATLCFSAIRFVQTTKDNVSPASRSASRIASILLSRFSLGGSGIAHLEC
jgi:hypothetical protein